MVNNRKVRLMTRLAIYEENEGKEDIRLSKYYRADYIRLNVLRAIVSVTIGYLLIVLIIGVYNSEFLIREAVTLDYRSLLVQYAGAYILILTVYIALCMIGYMAKYSSSRKKLTKYFRMLRRLRSIYREESGELSDGEEIEIDDNINS